MIVPVLFSWVSVTSTVTNVASSVPAHGTIVGPDARAARAGSAVISGLGVAASAGGGRILWAILGVLGAGTVLVAAVVAVFSPETIAQLFATTELIVEAQAHGCPGLGERRDRGVGSHAGDLTARVAFGAIVGVVGGALGVLGALLGFGSKRPRVGDDI